MPPPGRPGLSRALRRGRSPRGGAGTRPGNLGRVLGRPAAQIDAGERFLAAGGSSLKAMEVLAEIEDAFGITVAPAVLRDCDTVTALTDHVLAAGGARGANSTRPRPGGVQVHAAYAQSLVLHPTRCFCRFRAHSESSDPHRPHRDRQHAHVSLTLPSTSSLHPTTSITRDARVTDRSRIFLNCHSAERAATPPTGRASCLPAVAQRYSNALCEHPPLRHALSQFQSLPPRHAYLTRSSHRCSPCPCISRASSHAVHSCRVT